MTEDLGSKNLMEELLTQNNIDDDKSVEENKSMKELRRNLWSEKIEITKVRRKKRKSNNQ